MKLSGETLAQMRHDLLRLWASRASLAEGLQRIEAAPLGSEFDQQVFDWVLRHPSISTIGQLSTLSSNSTQDALMALLPEPIQRTFVLDLMRRLYQPGPLFQALSCAIPYSFAPSTILTSVDGSDLSGTGNPYADYGKAVSGRRFIGRKRYLQTLAARVTQPDNPGNLSLVGMPRIGKSSIATQGICYNREALLARSKVPIWVDLGHYSGIDRVRIFQVIVERTVDALRNQGFLTDGAVNKAQRICNHPADPTEPNAVLSEVLPFFESIRNCRIILVLDEFDQARKIWGNDSGPFQLLRALSNNSDTGVTLVTTSWRPVWQIEPRDIISSSLHGTFLEQYVGPFDMEDFGLMIQRLSESGVALSAADKETLRGYTGGHPFLMDILFFHLLNQRASGQLVSVPTACEQVAPEFVVHQYRATIELLHDLGLLATLQSVLTPENPNSHRNPPGQEAVQQLLRLGILTKSPSDYTAFSEHFQRYVLELPLTPTC